MMKHLLVILCCVVAFNAYATVGHNDNYVKSNLDTPGQILTFQKTTNSWMAFQNFFITTVYGVTNTDYVRRMYIDCLITKNDLRNSDDDCMPLNAKIVGYQLDGYYNRQHSNYMSVKCWMKTTGQSAIEYTSVNDGYLHNNYESYLTNDWLVRDSIMCMFSENATEQNPRTLFDVDFLPSKYVVFNGGNILMTIWVWGGENMNAFHYLCSPAQTEIATFFRSGNYGYGGPATTGSSSEIDNMVMAESYQLPAFRWKYYTNDIFVTVNLLDPNGNPIAQDEITLEQPDGRPLLSIYDMTAQKQVAISGATPNTEGFVSVTPGAKIEVLNVDYTHQYRVTVKSATCGQDEVVASFGAISDDIDLTFTMQQEQTDPDPVRGDLNGDGKVDIADVNISINTMLGKEPSTELSDLNGDGRTDIADVNIEINLMLGKDI
jgi:hypothetical protein